MTSVHHMANGRSILVISVALCAAFLTVSCGGAPPEILFADAQMFLFNDLSTGSVHESLRLYVAVNDGDGVDDLGLLSIVHDETELFWQAGPEDWVTVDQDGDSWIGLPDLRMPSGSVFPRGRYRVLLEDKARQEAEGSFGITAPPVDPETAEFPRLAEDEDGIRVIADESVVVRVFNRTGKLILSQVASPGILGETILRELPGEPGLQAYLSYPPGQAIRLMSGPYEVDR